MKKKITTRIVLTLIITFSLGFVLYCTVSGYTNYVYLQGAHAGYQLRQLDELTKKHTNIDSLLIKLRSGTIDK